MPRTITHVSAEAALEPLIKVVCVCVCVCITTTMLRESTNLQVLTRNDTQKLVCWLLLCQTATECQLCALTFIHSGDYKSATFPTLLDYLTLSSIEMSNTWQPAHDYQTTHETALHLEMMKFIKRVCARKKIYIFSRDLMHFETCH